MTAWRAFSRENVERAITPLKILEPKIMPISQRAILAIYGDLCDLVEKIETLDQQAWQPDLFEGAEDRQKAVFAGISALRIAANEIHEEAIGHILEEAPELEMNPLTGRIDE